MSQVLPLQDRLRHHLILAQQEQGSVPDSLRVLTDTSAHKLAQKIWTTYVNKEDFRKFPAFVQALDDMLIKFGGRSPQQQQMPPNQAPPQDVDEG